MKLKYGVFALACLLTAGCNKIKDHYLGILHGKPAACKLTEINYPQEADNVYKTQIAYNSWNFPSAVTYTTTFDFNPGVPFVYTFNYAYDNQKRILSLESDYFYGAENHHYYGYQGNSQLPSTDTIMGYVGDYLVQHLERDAFGRVIKITALTEFYNGEESPNLPGPKVYKYFYDAKGNRQEDPSNPDYPGVIKYTSKPSLYSLHPVWEIIYHNSSRNSPDFAETYNSNGYPTKIRTGDISWTRFLTVSEGASLVYQCKK